MRQTITVIDFGSSKIVTLIAEIGGTQRCDIIGAGTAPYDGFVEQEWNNPDELEEAIRQSMEAAQDQAKRNCHSVYVGVPGEFLQICTTEPKVDIQGTDPRVTKAHIDELFEKASKTFQLEYSEQLYQSPAWFIVDGGKKTLEPVGQKGAEMKALISTVYAHRSFTNSIRERLDHLGVGIENFYPSNVGQAILYLPEEARDRTAVLIDMGYLCTDIMIVEGDAVIFHETLGEGGGHITVEIAEKLGIQFATAEKLKREYCFDLNSRAGDDDIPEKTYEIMDDEEDPASAQNRTFTQSEVEAVVDPYVEDMCKRIKECIEGSGIKLGQWSNYYLTGGGLSINRGAREFLSTQLGKPVRELPRRSNKVNSQIYTSAMGLMDLSVDMANSSSTPGKLTDFFRSLLGS